MSSRRGRGGKGDIQMMILLFYKTYLVKVMTKGEGGGEARKKFEGRTNTFSRTPPADRG